jgi:protein SCO1/2
MKRLVFIALILVIAIPIAYFMVNQANTPALPFINPTDVQSEMVDSSVQHIGRNHKIGAFNLLDEQNKAISDEVIEGKVFVAEYFFTTCGSICPIMNKEMQRVQAAFKGNSTFEILSFTVDPENDGPEQMLAYAKAHGYQPGQWHFITGNKKDLYSLARTSFFVLKPAEAENLGDAGSDFIHTNNFVLVDQDRHIRGYYDGTNAAEVDQLILDIEKLLEPK